MKLFLRWVFLNTFLFTMLGVSVYFLGGRIHGAALVAIPIILLIFLLTSLKGGALALRADRLEDKFRSKDIYWRNCEAGKIMHEAENLKFYAWICQLTGILSTIAGFWVILSKSGTADLATQVHNGAGVALLGSFIGVLASLVLRVEHHDLSQVLESEE